MLIKSYIFLAFGTIFATIAVAFLIFQCFFIATLLYAVGLYFGVKNWFKNKDNMFKKTLPIVFNGLLFFLFLYLSIEVAIFFIGDN